MGAFYIDRLVCPGAALVVHHFADDGCIPNNPALPVLVYRQALALPEEAAAACEAIFAANRWQNAWTNGIYTFHHYHSTAHEALAICRGEAHIQLGGEQGLCFNVRRGDVMVLPAGVGHKNLWASGDFLVVGAYPPQQEWDICTGRPGERPAVLENIARVPLPPSDPVFGVQGPLMQHWGVAER